MSSLARSLLIVAAVEGLLLTPIHADSTNSPHVSRSRRATPVPSRAASPSPFACQSETVQVDYRTGTVRKLLKVNEEHRAKEREGGLEVHGIAGLLSVSPTASYLIAITSRKQVATINRLPVYVITDVSLIPLSSQAAAQETIISAKASRIRNASDSEMDTDLSDDEESSVSGEGDNGNDSAINAISNARSSTESDRDDSTGSKGIYGLFAKTWLGRGWRTIYQKEHLEDTVTKYNNVEGPQTSVNMVGHEPASEGLERPTRLPLRQFEVRPVPELESFPALPLSEEEQEELSKTAGQVQEKSPHRLTPKLLHTTRLLLGSSRSFFFSYDMDITRSWSQNPLHGKTSRQMQDVPLWKNVDPLYFWNKHLMQPFISSNEHSLILPLMQGFVGQKVFYTPTSPEAQGPHSLSPPQIQPFVLTLISRRSTRRAGLRYLRRGVDSEGNVANCVETEQLLAVPTPSLTPTSTVMPPLNQMPPDQWPWAKVYSFVQTRGSIPIYFQQSPYTLRPKPVLLHSESSNKAAFARHFNSLESRYNGEVFSINLVERGSAEHIVGDKYQRYVEELNRERDKISTSPRRVGFNWFDFHNVCKGMKFEKVLLLLGEIEQTLDKFGWAEVKEGGSSEEGDFRQKVNSVQKGIVRTNCMDCLDRTNVVQSACGRRALEKQLKNEGVDITEDSTDWLNLVWADNGDAISKQYASTAALKGDFTRTHKRNYRGALTDLRLTINRYFTNIISDFFTQAVIDFLLGNVSNHVFDEFEAEMMTKDPASIIGVWSGEGDKVGDIRANAIEISSKIVIAGSDDSDDSGPIKGDGKEMLIKGWTFLTPNEENTVRTFPFQETVLLLSTHALYSCRFDFALEKVLSFERVNLRSIRELQVGTYITSTLAPSSVDEEANVGFVVKFVTSGEVRRVNTRTIKSRVHTEFVEVGKESTIDPSEAEYLTGYDSAMNLIAFKALPRTSAICNQDRNPKGRARAEGTTHLGKEKDEDMGISSREHVRSVCMKIEEAVLDALPDGGESLSRRVLAVEGNDGTTSTTAASTATKSVTPAVEEIESKQRNIFRGVLIHDEDIISLEQAKQRTGLFEKWGYQVKRLVWA